MIIQLLATLGEDLGEESVLLVDHLDDANDEAPDADGHAQDGLRRVAGLDGQQRKLPRQEFEIDGRRKILLEYCPWCCCCLCCVW